MGPEEGRCALSELPPRSKTELPHFLRSDQPAGLLLGLDLVDFVPFYCCIAERFNKK